VPDPIYGTVKYSLAQLFVGHDKHQAYSMIDIFSKSYKRYRGRGFMWTWGRRYLSYSGCPQAVPIYSCFTVPFQEMTDMCSGTKMHNAYLLLSEPS